MRDPFVPVSRTWSFSSPVTFNKWTVYGPMFLIGLIALFALLLSYHRRCERPVGLLPISADRFSFVEPNRLGRSTATAG